MNRLTVRWAALALLLGVGFVAANAAGWAEEAIRADGGEGADRAPANEPARPDIQLAVIDIGSAADLLREVAEAELIVQSKERDARNREFTPEQLLERRLIEEIREKPERRHPENLCDEVLKNLAHWRVLVVEHLERVERNGKEAYRLSEKFTPRVICVNSVTRAEAPDYARTTLTKHIEFSVHSTKYDADRNEKSLVLDLKWEPLNTGPHGPVEIGIFRDNGLSFGLRSWEREGIEAKYSLEGARIIDFRQPQPGPDQGELAHDTLAREALAIFGPRKVKESNNSPFVRNDPTAAGIIGDYWAIYPAVMVNIAEGERRDYRFPHSGPLPKTPVIVRVESARPQGGDDRPANEPETPPQMRLVRFEIDNVDAVARNRLREVAAKARITWRFCDDEIAATKRLYDPANDEINITFTGFTYFEFDLNRDDATMIELTNSNSKK